MGGLGVKVQHFPLTLLVVLTTLTLPCERDTLINIIIAYTPNALRDAVDLDACNATFFSKICNVSQFTLYVLHLSHFTSIQNGSSLRPLWNLAHDDFAPD